MKESTIEKIERVKSHLDKQGIFYNEHANGHLKVDTVNLWSTSEKWHDTTTGDKGVGVNGFISHLKQVNKI